MSMVKCEDLSLNLKCHKYQMPYQMLTSFTILITRNHHSQLEHLAYIRICVRMCREQDRSECMRYQFSVNILYLFSHSHCVIWKWLCNVVTRCLCVFAKRKSSELVMSLSTWSTHTSYIDNVFKSVVYNTT